MELFSESLQGTTYVFFQNFHCFQFQSELSDLLIANFVQNNRSGSDFILLQEDIHVSKHHLVHFVFSQCVYFGHLVKYQIIKNIHTWLFYILPLIYMSGFFASNIMPYEYSCMVYLELWNGNSSNSTFCAQESIGYLGSFMVPMYLIIFSSSIKNYMDSLRLC